MDVWMIWKSFINVLYLNQSKDLMTASYWEHIYPLEKLFCLILIFLDFFTTTPYLERSTGQTTDVDSFVQQIQLYPHHILSPVIVKNLPWALYVYLKWIKEWVMCDPYVRSTSKCIYNSLLNAPCLLFITQIHPPPTTKVFSGILSVGRQCLFEEITIDGIQG